MTNLKMLKKVKKYLQGFKKDVCVSVKVDLTEYSDNNLNQTVEIYNNFTTDIISGQTFSIAFDRLKLKVKEMNITKIEKIEITMI